MEEQKQYRDDLLEWCNNLYSYWNSKKSKVSELLDVECVKEWEGSCRQLKEKLQTDLNVDYDDYLTAKSLYEQCEQLFVETNTYQEELGVDNDKRLVWEKQTQCHEELLEILNEWEGSCRQLKEKLQTDLNVDYDDYLTAKSLYEQWERLFVEPNAYQEELEADSDHRLELGEQTLFNEELLERDAYQEELEVDSDHRMEWEKQTQFREGLLERYAYQEELEVESDHRLEGVEQTQFHEELLEGDAYHEELEVERVEQPQYRDELLKWCNSIYSNWESMKPTFSKLFDLKSLEEWEGSYRYLKEKLQADVKADLDDYQTAQSLYEQLELLIKESYAYQGI
ncbi:hypothetical protein KW850_27380 [Bacillus sp. sid0103]|uniref:hypothetical protein n=1 Tax=Bacillus sp. sid0103 TaxID=2856337 RepID=UPI001C44093F|nr:hypothetical protein [Bacillus sp. sid0103]MBV7508929.1 hypothetical protein [Bacillus sp. sid0103]